MPLASQRAKVLGIYASPDLRQMEYVTHWVPASSVVLNADSASSIATALGHHVLDILKPVLTTECFVLGAKVYIYDGSVLYTRHVLATLPNGGSVSSSDVLPDHVAACITYESSLPGRPGLGRWFLGCVPEIYTQDNHLTGPGQTAYEGFAEAVLAPFVPGVGQPAFDCVHLSKKLGETGLIDFVTPHPLLKRQGRRLFRTLL